MRDSLQRLLAATKVSDVTTWLSQLELPTAWKPVGGRENNFGIIHIGSDPAAALVERITNAIDAVLERAWREQGRPDDIRSPRRAVEAWFQIPHGRLREVQDIRDLSDLTDRVVVTLYDSERAERPTVDIRDRGCGIRAEDFEATILSLNEDIKLRKLYLAGAYGQGGSTALSFSEYTLIVSRAMPHNGHPVQPVAFTVVRYNPGHPDLDKHGRYEYLVNGRTGVPFTVVMPDEVFETGTLVRHVAMNLGKYHRLMTAPQESLYWLVHNYLFDPVLPFRIEEQRDNKSKGHRRPAAGNHRRLSHSELTEYQRQSTQTFRSGQVTLSWWVLSTQGDNPRERINHYTLPSQPIIITFNGQRQGYLPNTVIKDDLRLPYLDRYLIVHVDCDKLDGDSRRQLFATTREAVRETPILHELRRLVCETLAEDENLKRLNDERKARYLRRTDSESIQNIKRRLARRVRALAAVGGTGPEPRISDAGGGGTVRERPPIPVSEPPTYLRIVTAGPRKAYPGRRFVLRFETDADPSYFVNPDSFLAIIDPPSFGQYTGTTNVLNGHGHVYFTVNDDTPVGETAEITLELRPPRQRALRDAIGVEVIEPPQDSGGGSGQGRAPNINPHWIGPEDAYWQDNNWDDGDVAAVEESDDSVDIFVSRENRHLVRLVARAQRHGERVIEDIRNFYLEHISFHAYLAELGKRRHGEYRDGEHNGNRLYREELLRAAETVCGIIESLFDQFVAIARVEYEDGAE